ncbi:MAG: hypothetical protein ACLU81_00780 [Lachnospira eligens]
MVQNKQKSNKINITALITCFMLIVVFVFGCVQFAFAADSSENNKLLDYANTQLAKRSDYKYYIGYSYEFRTSTYSSNFSIANIEGNKVCGFFETYNKGSSWGFLSDSSFKFDILDSYSWFNSRYDETNKIYYCKSSSTADIVNYNYAIVSNVLTFATYDDAVYYMKTGQINNAIYKPSGSYDKNIPTPKNLEVYFDRKLNKPFNLADLCNPLKVKWTIPEDSDYSDYTLDVQIDVNYNKLNSISGIGTKPTILQTGKVEFASCSATDKELNISATYDGWTKLLEKYQSSTWGLTGNYFDLWLRYKDSSGNYGNWVKVTINPDNSSTVIKAGLFDNGTNTTINKGYEEISGDNGEHVNGDYDNYYVNTLDDNISNNLTSLKNNYSNLVSFYKELFSFLPAEIWIILIGLVSTMVVIAIIKFVRG